MVGRGLVVLALAVVLTACDQSANRVSTLWTDVPEMASYVEKFNASQRDWQILVEYRAAPATLLTTPGRKADLVISRDLASSAVKDVMVPLDFLFDGGNLAKASFYRRILDAGTQGDRTKLVPVAFDLPILEYAPQQTPGLPGFSLDLDAVKDLSVKFGTGDAKSFRRMGFSPRWEAFSLTVLQMQGANFQEGFQGVLSWDSARLLAGLNGLKDWPSPGWNQVTDFRAKYLQVAAPPLLAAGRIQFYPSTLGTLLSRPWEDRRNVDFRYVDQGGRIQAADTVVWAGIPSSSLTRGAAERFLSWFFQPEVQKKLILQGRLEDDRSFGLAGGLSAQVAANVDAVPAVFPELSGRIPLQDQVAFWGPLPANWPLLKSSVLGPWLETSTADEALLRSLLDKHRSQAVRD